MDVRYFDLKRKINHFLKWTVLLLVFVPLSSWGQSAHLTPQQWADSLLLAFKSTKTNDPRFRLSVLDSVFNINKRANNNCKQTSAKIYMAGAQDQLGQLDSALNNLMWANQHLTESCDSTIRMHLFITLSGVYLSLEEYKRLDSVSLLALDYWNPSWPDKAQRFSIMTNMGIGQFQQGDSIQCLTTFHNLLHETQTARDTEIIISTLINLGTVKGISNDLDSAYYYLSQASSFSKSIRDSTQYLDLQFNLAMLDFDRGNNAKALIRLDSVFSLAQKRGNIDVQSLIQNKRAKYWAGKKRFEKAYEYILDHLKLREQLLNEERVKAVTEMQEKYESEKKVRQIKELQVANLDASLTNERIKSTRNRLMFGGSGILILAIGLWSRLRQVRKSRAAIQKEKEVSEGLLLNILPASVAEELKIKGSAEAKLYPVSTILFSDFKDFTEISGELSPTDLVDELNVCFKEFDMIMTKHGLEKIKTIGDAYMAAASIPDNNKATALESIHAALDMQRFIATRKKERNANQFPAFEMRVGIHSGPVVAGIVGVKKFQYDLWGDTVNIASRMETNGEAGQVNISEATFNIVQSEPSLHFIPRGNIQVKGKGEMQMYFVELA
jgi:class 3 adenylate cyclase